MKTNKAVRKRVKVTKKGKVLTRKKGQGHYNAKQVSKKRTTKRKPTTLHITNKAKARFLSGVK